MEVIAQGNLSKMPTQFDRPINYFLPLGGETIRVNDLLGQKLSLKFDGRINCVSCGKLTRKPFGQGFCYPCFATSPDNAECIVRPELCEGHLGKGRDPEWELKHHVQPHFVYLALSSGLKVGITRETQIPTRWIDQGASKAIILAEVPYRQLSGIIEVALKATYDDKTNWQRMLKNEVADMDLIQHRSVAASLLPSELQHYLSVDDKVWELTYPHLDVPKKVSSVQLMKTPIVEGILTGVKGQYLIIDNTFVLNVRNHAGFHIDLAM